VRYSSYQNTNTTHALEVRKLNTTIKQKSILKHSIIQKDNKRFKKLLGNICQSKYQLRSIHTNKSIAGSNDIKKNKILSLSKEQQLRTKPSETTDTNHNQLVKAKQTIDIIIKKVINYCKKMLTFLLPPENNSLQRQIDNESNKKIDKMLQDRQKQTTIEQKQSLRTEVKIKSSDIPVIRHVPVHKPVKTSQFRSSEKFRQLMELVEQDAILQDTHEYKLMTVTDNKEQVKVANVQDVERQNHQQKNENQTIVGELEQ